MCSTYEATSFPHLNLFGLDHTWVLRACMREFPEGLVGFCVWSLYMSGLALHCEPCLITTL
ncbi:MAG: hypothetical protein D8B53_04060 [Corynebacterium sp.]|nr:MAG: hypothetical protein D8B53_04060 [Corynebacterium sp.]